MMTETAMKEPEVTLSVFGARRHRSRITGPEMTVGDVLREHDVNPDQHRLARNGNPVTTTENVREGDELTLVPRIQAG
jgi:sulfur carrier protein ThiS